MLFIILLAILLAVIPLQSMGRKGHWHEPVVHQMKWVGFRVGVQVLSWLDELRARVVPPELQMWELSSSFLRTQTLYAAAQLNLAEHLLTGDASHYHATPRTLSDLITKCHVTQPVFFTRMMHYLEQFRIVRRQGDQYHLTPTGELLWESHPLSARAMILTQGSNHYLAASSLYDSLRGEGDQSAFQLYFPSYENVWEYLNAHPSQSVWFNQYMENVNAQLMEYILEDCAHPSLYESESVLDVGGGQGHFVLQVLAMALKKQMPSLPRIGVFDRAALIEEAEATRFWNEQLTQLTTSSGSPQSIQGERLAGDFFQSIPPGWASYVLKFVLHDWTDEGCVRILSRVREAMTEDGRVYIVENVMHSPWIPDSLSQSHAAIDLIMAIMTSGQERSLSQYDALLRQAGLQITRFIPTRSPVSIIEAVKA